MTAGQDSDRNYCGEMYADWMRIKNKEIVHKNIAMRVNVQLMRRGMAIIIFF
jgi:ribosomal protein S20